MGTWTPRLSAIIALAALAMQYKFHRGDAFDIGDLIHFCAGDWACPGSRNLCLQRGGGNAVGCNGYQCCVDTSKWEIGDNCWIGNRPRHDLCPRGAGCYRKGFDQGSDVGCDGYHCCTDLISFDVGEACLVDSEARDDLCPRGTRCLKKDFTRGNDMGCDHVHCCTDIQLGLGDLCSELGAPQHDWCPRGASCVSVFDPPNPPYSRTSRHRCVPN